MHVQEYMQHTGMVQPVVRKLPLDQPSSTGDLNFSYRTDLNFEFLNFVDFPRPSLQVTKAWHDLEWAILAKTPQARSGQGVGKPEGKLYKITHCKFQMFGVLGLLGHMVSALVFQILDGISANRIKQWLFPVSHGAFFLSNGSDS